MSFSVLSFLNAVFWFNLGLIPIAILQARWKIAMKYSPALLAALAILAGVRVFLPLDGPTLFCVFCSKYWFISYSMLCQPGYSLWLFGLWAARLYYFANFISVCKTGGPGKAGSTYITIRLSAQQPRWEFRCG